jgi:hypothetical protein
MFLDGEREIRHLQKLRKESLPSTPRSWSRDRPTACPPKQQQLVDRITNECPDVVPLRRISLAFREALTSQEGEKMQQQTDGTKRCEFGSLVRFAYGLQKDMSAFTAAVDMFWAQGK